jgi:hypothetical protein
MISFEELNNSLNEYNLIKTIMEYIKYTPETHYNLLIEKYGDFNEEELYKNEKFDEEFIIKYSDEIEWEYYIMYHKITKNIWKKCRISIECYAIEECYYCGGYGYLDSECDNNCNSYCQDCLKERESCGEELECGCCQDCDSICFCEE